LRYRPRLGREQNASSAWTCNQITNENCQPLVPSKGNNAAPVISRVSGSNSYCLDIPDGHSVLGLAMQIYRCNQTLSQMWQLRPDGSLVVHKVTQPCGEPRQSQGIFVRSYTGIPLREQVHLIAPDPIPGGMQEPNRPVNLAVCGNPPQ
jgi:hypothetical protein